MKKFEIIKKQEDFNYIIHNCPYLKNKEFTIYIKKREEKIPKFGLAISKKVGNAVVRNKLKRQVRSIVDKNKEIFSNDSDYIIMIKKGCLEQTFQNLEKKLIELIR